jgi:hypothetical protein
MILDISKAFSFLLSMMSLYYVVQSAFFVPGTHWEDRLELALAKIALAACVCFASGLLFSWRQQTDRGQHDPHAYDEPLMSTLPVRMFFWTLLGVAILFALAWYLDAYYVPLLWRNQP